MEQNHTHNFRFLYDGSERERMEKDVLPMLEGMVKSVNEWSPETEIDTSTEENLLLYLSDDQLKDLLPTLTGSGISVAILPHPDAFHACSGMGVDLNTERAIEDLKNSQKPVSTDLLFCNDRAVLNKLIIGEAFKITRDEFGAKRTIWQRTFGLLWHFFNMRPFQVDITIRDDRVIKTAVAGIVIPEHRKSSLISKIVLENTEINDGKFHTFLISPRSLLELLHFGITSLWRKGKLPPFASHIKTAQLGLNFPGGPRDFYIDGRKMREQQIQLYIDEKQLRIFPGSQLDLPDSNRSTTDAIKTTALPPQDVAVALSKRKIPLIKQASAEEFKDLFKVLRENAGLKNSYLVLMVLSTIIATFGLFANSTPVVIGAMILAPLMSPIISLSMGALRQDRSLIYNSIITILAGLALSVLFAVILTWFTPLHTPGSEILSRTRPNLLDLGIAVFSGIAGAYAHAREEVAKTLAGVAIAVALIPPLAVAAIGIGWADWSVFSGATLLLLTNLAGMVLAAAATFLLLGFSPIKLATRGIAISTVLVVVLSIPLALGFNQMLFEHNIIRELEGLETPNAIIRDVKVQKIDPVNISFKLVSEDPISPIEIDAIKQLIESRLEKEVQIEVTPTYLR